MSNYLSPRLFLKHTISEVIQPTIVRCDPSDELEEALVAWSSGLKENIFVGHWSYSIVGGANKTTSVLFDNTDDAIMFRLSKP